MSQAVITKAFTEWKAQQSIDNQPVTLDDFIFAYIPGLDTETPIDNTEAIPTVDKIVHRQAVSKSGVVNENAVVYSVTLGADVGDFDFNWIGLANKATGTLAMIIHAPTQRKIKNASGQQGNVLVRSMLMEYSGAKTATEITTPAETWQIDFTARLAAMDERQRRENIDLYGDAAFFDSGYLVAKSGTQFYVTKGAGYVAGLRSELLANQNITVSAKPVRVWLDVCWTGTLTSEWAVQSKITVAASLTDYEQNGVQHYVFAVASIDAGGNITDLRPKGTLNDQQASDALKKHEKSRNHPDASTTEKGFTQLSSATDSDSEELSATPKAVKAVREHASNELGNHEQSRNHPDATTDEKGFVQLYSGVASESEAMAATPKAIKIAMDNANSRLAKNRNGSDIPNPVLFVQNIGLGSFYYNNVTGESSVFNGNKNLHYYINNNNESGVSSIDFGILWGFNGGGELIKGSIPVKRLTGLASSTGSSSVDVMSQKAVTDAINIAASIGVNQLWHDVTAVRAVGTNYINDKGRPIVVAMNIKVVPEGLWASNITVQGIQMTCGSVYAGEHRFLSVVVPPGQTYMFNPLATSNFILLELY